MLDKTPYTVLRAPKNHISPREVATSSQRKAAGRCAGKKTAGKNEFEKVGPLHLPSM